MARPKRKDKKEQRYTLLLRPVLWDTLEQQAQTEGVTVNRLIELCLEERYAAIVQREDAMKTPVFGTNAFWFNGIQHRAIVACRSKTAASRAFGLKGRGLEWIGETCNRGEISTAMQEPGAVFVCSMSGGTFKKA